MAEVCRMEQRPALLTVVDKSVMCTDGLLTESPKITNIHELVVDDEPNEFAHETAEQILNGTFKDVDPKEYANFLGSPKNSEVLTEFLDLLRPYPATLLDTLKKLSSSIYFIAEAANIDMILESLAKEWLREGHMPHYNDDFRLAHIMLFSLLMLNSNLHNPASEHKFSLDQFLENSLHALRREAPNLNVAHFKRELTSGYIILSRDPLPLCAGPKKKSRGLSRRTGASGSGMRKISMLSMRSDRLQRTPSHQSLTPSLNSMPPLAPKTTTNTILTTGGGRLRSRNVLEKLYAEEKCDWKLQDVNGSPWLMDCVLKVTEAAKTATSTPQLFSAQAPKRKMFSWFRKHAKGTLFDEHAHLAHVEHWTYARVRAGHGRLLVYYFRGSTLQDYTVDQILKWDLMTCRKKCSHARFYTLYGALASRIQDNIVASKHSALGRSSFMVSFPSGISALDGITLQFSTDNADIAAKYKDTINFWGGRITPIPSAQMEMVSNEEYGWSDRILSGKIQPQHAKVFKWKPLMGLDAVLVEADEQVAFWELDSQLYNMRSFVSTLERSLDTHNSLKAQMVQKWQNVEEREPEATESAFDVVMDNWNNKYLYLNKQYEKHTIYLDALEKACDFYQKSE
ncbi:LAMI_0D12574g1_1 [Lachancea mirantina]|uniref:Guanine-nucleotide exchange factor YEL1 n=1 Tax=Lachancea mirantina TaxID=1230905 RepID=A0A1G4JFR1_9SACH|nr:LAMI_0D12574g1_1 [Lachancea mirantina]